MTKEELAAIRARYTEKFPRGYQYSQARLDVIALSDALEKSEARAEALERAIKTTIPCKFCRLGVPETALCYASGWEDCKGTYFDFDEARFKGGEK